MASEETPLMKELLIRASDLGSRLFRQNAGMAWTGKAERITRARTVQVFPGDVVVRKARPFHAAKKGRLDLVGWTPVEITPDMAGQTLAVYSEVEVKDQAKPSKEQLQRIDVVQRAGGISGIAHNELELEQILSSKSGSKK